jgi:hypothetical protein
VVGGQVRQGIMRRGGSLGPVFGPLGPVFGELSGTHPSRLDLRGSEVCGASITDGALGVSGVCWAFAGHSGVRLSAWQTA